MSLSITLTTDDVSKLSDTSNLLTLLLNNLLSDDNANLIFSDRTFDHKSVSSLISWYNNLLAIINYNGYAYDASLDEGQLDSLVS